MAPFLVTVASPHELIPALRVLFGPSATQPGRRRDALTLGDCDPAGLFVARNATGRICGAVLVQTMPGALGVTGLPRGETIDVENALMMAACDWLRGSGVKVCQAFASATELSAMAPLERAGFRHVTQLAFLRCDLTLSTGPLTSPTGPLTFTSGVPPLTDEFRTTLVATHEGTRDCPELNGARTADELLIGFTDAMPGTQWYLAIHESTPVGVVILAPGAGSQSVELSYLGIVPGARGRGFGGELLKFARDQASIAGFSALTLSVDVRNEPAVRLYRRQGFVETDRPEVFLAQWGG